MPHFKMKLFHLLAALIVFSDLEFGISSKIPPNYLHLIRARPSDRIRGPQTYSAQPQANLMNQQKEIPSSMEGEDGDNCDDKDEIRLQASSSAPETEQATDENFDILKIGEIVNHLSSKLMDTIGGSGNVFLSPLSISIALAMTYRGAAGKTAADMDRSLGYSTILGEDNKVNLHPVFHEFLSSLGNNSKGYQLFIANGLFLQAGMSLRQEFITDLKNMYFAEVGTVNFAKDPSGTMDSINSWVSEKTQDTIPQILQQSPEPTTIAAIFNAVYFKGIWKFPFAEKTTNEMEFYALDGSAKKVSFMHQKRRFPYYHDENLGYSFLKLPYKGKNVSMMLILPDRRTQAPTLSVSNELLSRIRNKFRGNVVEVAIPKFQMSYERELSEDMTHMGMASLFSKQSADLSGMRQRNDLYISMMLHKAVVNVDEQGTEAAGSTGMMFASRSGHSRNKEFFANHPFLFVILEKRSGVMLFVGRVSDPQISEK